MFTPKTTHHLSSGDMPPAFIAEFLGKLTHPFRGWLSQCYTAIQDPLAAVGEMLQLSIVAVDPSTLGRPVQKSFSHKISFLISVIYPWEITLHRLVISKIFVYCLALLLQGLISIESFPPLSLCLSRNEGILSTVAYRWNCLPHKKREESGGCSDHLPFHQREIYFATG